MSEQKAIENNDDYRSKSEQKREIQEITKLGKRLLEIPKDKLITYPLSETSIKAILEGKRITSPIGRNRQIKYIGKLLRSEDMDAVQEQLDILDQEKLLENRKFHDLEAWRDSLITDGNSALTDLLNEYYHLDRQHLRQLIRNAINEEKRNQPPKSKRLIFQYLKENI